MDTYDINLTERVLEFFNKVTESDEIVSRIYDDPNYGASSGEAYGVSPDIAQKILAVRDALPDQQFVSLQQINDIHGVGPNTFHDILYSFQRLDFPQHQWDGTKLRFQNANGTWGEFHDLKGDPGPAGLQEPPGDGYSGALLNPQQTALLRWYDANEADIAYSVGEYPQAICFDGHSVWVANISSNDVTKFRASDGATVGTYSVGDRPTAICFDGQSIWVANGRSNNVTKLRASDGAIVGTYSVGDGPTAICFDGQSIWVANGKSNSISRL